MQKKIFLVLKPENKAEFYFRNCKRQITQKLLFMEVQDAGN